MARPVALVTGAANGIGLETSRRLAATHSLALLDLDGDGARRAAAQIGSDALAVQCDITDGDALARAVEATVERFGGIDVVISNAGVATAGALRHLDPDVVDAQLKVNLVGNWRTIHACLPHVIARRGYVLGVSSASALVAPPGIGAYAASKAGLAHLLNVLRVELRPFGVAVGVAYFSFIDTDMVRGTGRHHPGFQELRDRMKGPVAKTYPVGDAADAIVRGVQRRSRRVVAPKWVSALYRVQGLAAEALDRQAARESAEIDRITAELVAERGAFAGGLRPDDRGADAAAAAVHR